MGTYSDRAKNHQITTILIHRGDDAAIIAWLKQQKNNTEAIKRAVYFYMQHAQGQIAAPTAPIDQEALRGVIAEALADHLADIRQIIQTALETYTPRPLGEGPGVRAESDKAEVNNLLANLIVSLDL